MDSCSQEKPEVYKDKIVNKDLLSRIFEFSKSMPICFERRLGRFLYYVSMKLDLGDQKEQENLKDIIEKEITLLEECSKNEELISVNVKDFIEKCYNYTKIEDWESAVKHSRQMLKELRTLDIQEMLWLLRKNEDESELIKDKNIVLFLGGAGSGKSTTIHFLAGSKMQNIQINGIDHIAPVDIKNPSLKKVTPSPFSESGTRHIACVPVNYADIGASTKGDIVLCETPAFEGTTEPEVDIATSMGIVKAIRKCNSVKPVILITYKSFEEGLRGLKDLMHILVGMIPELWVCMSAFSYFFTKYPEKERRNINSSLRDIHSNFCAEVEEVECGYSTILKDMIRKTRNILTMIDPINGDPREILDELSNTAQIRYPDEVFQFSMTETSKAALHDQIRKHQLSIIYATKNFNYDLIKYKLDELKALTELFDYQDYISQTYMECVKSVSKHLMEYYYACTSALNHCLLNENSLKYKDMEEYKTCIERALKAEELRNSHLNEEVFQISGLNKNMNTQVTRILSDLKEAKINNPLVKTILDKLKLLSSFFIEYKPHYEEGCQYLMNKFDSKVESFKSSVNQNNFDEGAEEISLIHSAITMLQEHLSNEKTTEKYNQLRKFFLKAVSDSTAKLGDIFEKNRIDQNDIDKITETILKLEKAKNTLLIKEDIDEVHKKLMGDIFNYFKELYKKVKKNLETDSTNSFSLNEKLIKEMELIRKIPNFDCLSAQLYSQTVEMLCGFVLEIRRNVEQGLIFTNSKIDYHKLFIQLSVLENSDWIDNIQPGFWSEAMKAIEKGILQYMEQAKQVINNTNLSIENPNKLEDIHLSLQKLYLMKSLGKAFSKLLSNIEDVLKSFENKIEKIFSLIKSFIVKKKEPQDQLVAQPLVGSFKGSNKNEYQDLDFKNIEKSIIFLQTCYKLELCPERYSVLLEEAENFIAGYKYFLKNQIEFCHSSIMSYEMFENTNNLFNFSQQLSTHLGEIFQLRDKYPKVYSIFDPNGKMIQEWQNKFIKIIFELSFEMEQYYNAGLNKELNNKLLTIKALSMLDPILNIHEKFSKIYQEYQNKFNKSVLNNPRKAITAIENCDFELVFSEMSQFEKVDDNICKSNFNDLKRILNNSVRDLIAEIQSTAKLAIIRQTISPEKCASIAKSLEKIKKAKKFISVYLEVQDTLDECVENVKKLLCTGLMNVSNTIEAMIETYNFPEVYQQLNELTASCEALGTYCDEKIIQRAIKLENIQNEKLTELTKIYLNLPLEKYLLRPPKDILSKFSKIADLKPEYYKVKNSITEAIVQKFREELEAAKTVEFSGNINPNIRKCEWVLDCYPEDIKKFLQLELLNCKEHECIQKGFQEELKHILQSKNLTAIKNLVDDCKLKKRQNSILKIEDETVLQMEEIKGALEKAVAQRNTKEIFIEIKKLFEYKTHLGTFSRVISLHSTIQKIVWKTFDEVYSSFLHKFRDNNTFEITESVEKEFECLIGFMEFIDNEKSDSEIIKDMIPPTYNDKFNQINIKLLEYLKTHQIKYQNSLDSIQIKELKIALGVMKKWDILFKSLKKKVPANKIIDAKQLTETLEKLKLHKELITEMFTFFKQLRDSIMDAELVTNK